MRPFAGKEQRLQNQTNIRRPLFCFFALVASTQVGRQLENIQKNTYYSTIYRIYTVFKQNRNVLCPTYLNFIEMCVFQGLFPGVLCFLSIDLEHHVFLQNPKSGKDWSEQESLISKQTPTYQGCPQNHQNPKHFGVENLNLRLANSFLLFPKVTPSTAGKKAASREPQLLKEGIDLLLKYQKKHVFENDQTLQAFHYR